MRYRAERHDYGDLRTGLRSAARKAGVPLALAAAATAVGFASFVPTAYRGLAELGEIAGCGMILAFLISITLLPALLMVLNPPVELHPMGFAALRRVDRFIQRYRMPVVVTTLLLVVLAAPLLLFLPFDFNPLHLRNPNVESVATFLDLRKDPQTGANAIEIIAPSLGAADAVRMRLASLPQVSQVDTLSRLIPPDQDQKRALIQDAAEELKPSINATEVSPPPTDEQNIEALVSTAHSLTAVAGHANGRGAEAARRLSGLLVELAKSEPSIRKAVEAAIVNPLRIALDQLPQELDPEQITADTIPADLKREWATPEGQARIEVLPKGDPDDTKVLRNFVPAVLAIAPNATGPAVLLFEAGNTGRAGVHRSRDLCPCRDCLVAVGHLATDSRCAVDPGAPSRRHCRDIGTMRRSRSSFEFCRHHSVTTAARRGRCLQNLLHHGMEKREDRACAIDPDASRDLQCPDPGNSVRQPVVV